MKFKVPAVSLPMNVLIRLRASPFAFPLAALAALAMFMISESSYQQATSTFDALGRQFAARTDLETLMRGLLDAETGQRGYLLTGRPEYLLPYTQGRAEVQHSLDSLDRFYRGDTQTAALMDRLSGAVRNKLSELAETLKLFDERGGGDTAWRELLMSNIGKEQMETVRALSAELLDAEVAKVTAGRRSLSQTLMLNRIGVTAMTALSLLALFMYLRQTSALVRQRDEQARAVQAERDQLEREVLRRTRQLTELARHLQTVREDERSHLARELHDELGALLTAAKLDVARLKSRLGPQTPEVSERLQHLNDGLNHGIALKRRIIEDLRPSSLSNLGLVAALEILVREWGDRSDTLVEADLQTVHLARSGELTVYRLVQEALTNVTKYAHARHVWVRLWAEGGRVRVSVRDDGVGFDPDAPRGDAHGLLGMVYRLESEAGELRLRSSIGAGTEIEADLPEVADAQRTAGDDAVATPQPG